MIYLRLFFCFLLIGAFTFGGGYAMLPLIQQEVLRNGWLSQEELINFVAISESTPGPFAINIATFVGSRTGGIPGALCATFGVVLPSFIIILTVAKMYERFQKSRIVKGAMVGLKGAVVGLIGAAVVTTGKSVFSISSISEIDITFFAGCGIFLLMLFLLMKKVNPIVIVIGSAVLGIVIKALI